MRKDQCRLTLAVDMNVVISQPIHRRLPSMIVSHTNKIRFFVMSQIAESLNFFPKALKSCLQSFPKNRLLEGGNRTHGIGDIQIIDNKNG